MRFLNEMSDFSFFKELTSFVLVVQVVYASYYTYFFSDVNTIFDIYIFYFQILHQFKGKIPPEIRKIFSIIGNLSKKLS